MARASRWFSQYGYGHSPESRHTSCGSSWRSGCPGFENPDEPEPGQSRLHIDVNVTDRDQHAELDHLLRLGARPANLVPGP